MSYRSDHGGSGTLAVDEYRTSMGLGAAGALSAGQGVRCVSGDHSGANELCVETIVRLAGSATKASGSDATMNSIIQTAVLNLRNGLGVHKKQSDHSGGNNCAQVIGLAT